MQRDALINHIKGSFLKEQYLEAFLVQSAYIENLLKVFANYSFFVDTKATAGSAMALAVAKRIEKYGFGELVDFLHEAKLIDEDQQNILDQYRKQKNKVMQDLLKDLRRDEFEKELRTICERGTVIMESKPFRDMAELVEALDEEKLPVPHQAALPQAVAATARPAAA